MGKLKKTISLFLVLCLVLSFAPLAALAADQGIYEVDTGCSSHSLNGETGRCNSCGALIVASATSGAGTAYYTSLEAALNAGGSVKILQDIIPDSNCSVTVNSGVSVNLDLNGRCLGGGDFNTILSIVNYGKLTVSDSQDDSGEIHGSIYTMGYEVKQEYQNEYTGENVSEVTDCAYGASTVIAGGKIYGDAVVGHDDGRSYYPGESKPNPSLSITGGCFVGGTVCLLNENHGTIVISGGRFTVEPPEKYIINGYEAEKIDGYYHIQTKQFRAGWIEPSVTAASGLTEHTRQVVTDNSAVSGFVAGDMDLVNVTSLMISNGISFNPETDSLKCAMVINCTDAVVYGEGNDEKVTGLAFSLSPVFNVYHGGEYMTLGMGWDQITDDSMTIRLPVDSNLSCDKVKVFVGEAMGEKYVLDIQSDNSGNRFVQASFSSTELAAGVRYEALIKDICTIIYSGNGGEFDADGTILTSKETTVNGKQDLVLDQNLFERAHYSFAGWESNGNVYNEGDVIRFVVGDMTFNAVWNPDSYSITYVLNGGQNSLMNIDSYAYDTIFTLEAPTRENAVFAGWYDNEAFEGEPVTGLNPGDFGDRTFYAKWNVTVTLHISGDGSGTVADMEKVYSDGDVIELPMGDSFQINVFNADGSYIEAIRLNGEDQKVSALFNVDSLEQSIDLEIVFTQASSQKAQRIDLTAARASDGSELSSLVLDKAKQAFSNANMEAFASEDVQNSVDMTAAKAAFTAETGETVGEYDTVSVQLHMAVSGIHAKGSTIMGYTVDVKPVMTVIAAEGQLKGTAEVPNNAIVTPIAVRIPVDSMAYMDDAVVYHEGQLAGYRKIQGATPDRYVELETASFSEFEVLLVDGVTNHPQAAIGTTGYETVAKALENVTNGDTISILRDDATIPTVTAELYGETMTLPEAVAVAVPGDLISLPEYGAFVAIEYEKPMLMMAPMLLGGPLGSYTVTYHGNGGATAGKEETVIKTEQTIVLPNEYDSSFSDYVGFIHPDAEARFLYWNTQENGQGDTYYPDDTVVSDLDLYPVWYVAQVLDESGSLVGQYASISKAVNAAEPRYTVVLLADVIDDIRIEKEILFNFNGHAWERTDGKNFIMGDSETRKAFYDSNSIACLEYDRGSLPVAQKYQFRGQYTINYHMGTSTSATVKNHTDNPAEGTKTYLNKAITLKNPTKTRANGVDTDPKSASFAGWYRDAALKVPTTITGTVSETQVSITSCTISAVDAPSWPTESADIRSIDLYPRWMWNIMVAYNNYGYVMCNNKTISSNTTYYFDEGSRPEFKFVPNEGYHVFRATIKVRSFGETYKGETYSYVPCWYEDFKDEKGMIDRGLQINHTIVVTFARGEYNPETGDKGNTGLWIALMGLSLIGSGALLLQKKRREEY